MTNKYSQLYGTGATTDEKMVLNLPKKKKSHNGSALLTFAFRILFRQLLVRHTGDGTASFSLNLIR